MRVRAGQGICLAALGPHRHEGPKRRGERLPHKEPGWTPRLGSCGVYARTRIGIRSLVPVAAGALRRRHSHLFRPSQRARYTSGRRPRTCGRRAFPDLARCAAGLSLGFRISRLRARLWQRQAAHRDGARPCAHAGTSLRASKRLGRGPRASRQGPRADSVAGHRLGRSAFRGAALSRACDSSGQGQRQHKDRRRGAAQGNAPASA